MENLVPMTISMISEAENEQSDWSKRGVNHPAAAPLDYKLLKSELMYLLFMQIANRVVVVLCCIGVARLASSHISVSSGLCNRGKSITHLFLKLFIGSCSDEVL